MRLVQHARIILLAADGVESQEIAQRVNISHPTVQVRRQFFLALHVTGLEKEAPCPGQIQRISAPRSNAVVGATLQTTPPQATHWSTRKRGQNSRSQRGDVFGFKG